MAPARPARRYFVDERLVDALPPRSRVRLTGFLSVLLARSWRDEDLYGASIVVDAPRRELAQHCATSAATIARWEGELEEAGIVRRVDGDRRRRVLEILDPTFGDRLDRANRAVDNSVESGSARRRELLTGEQLSYSPVSNSARAYSIPGKREESRSPREEAAAARSARPARSAQIDHDLAVQVARALVGDVRERFGRELEERGGRREAWTLSRGQATQLEASIAGRVSALRRSGAGSIAVELAQRDVRRVVEYSVRAAVPAAHLYRAITTGDWRSDALEGSESARVRARGTAAEMPGRDADRRGGPDPRLQDDGAPTEADRARLARALDAAGASPAHREAAARFTTASQVRRAAHRIESELVKRQAALEVSA